MSIYSKKENPEEDIVDPGLKQAIRRHESKKKMKVKKRTMRNALHSSLELPMLNEASLNTSIVNDFSMDKGLKAIPNITPMEANREVNRTEMQ